MMKSIFGILIICLSGACGFLVGSGDSPEWNALKVTWGPDPFSPKYYTSQPLTIDEAKMAGFRQILSGCAGKFLGQRFIRGNDVGLMLLYDSHGLIAGIQTGIPASMITTEQYYKFSQQKMFNRDTVVGIDAYILTAYFVDPTTICQSNSRDKGKTGTGLWLQNGADPIRDSFHSPLHQTEISQTKWVQGACFPTMGIHYWYDNRVDSDCDTFFPVFLLYNKGKLTGLGWVVFGKYDFTERTEFPPLAAILGFLKPVPTCMAQRYNDAGGFTTMHIYFNAAPWNIVC